MERLFVQLDSRRRVSLGKLANPHDRYQLEVFPNGTIIATPVIEVPSEILDESPERTPAG